MNSKEQLINDIIENELEMFLNVASRGNASCQENPDGFKFYRKAMFVTWSEDALASYLDDVQQAKDSGRNLLTLKYARMEGLVPKENDNPLIDRIVDIEIAWAKEIANKYPNIQRRGRPIEEDSPHATSTKTYLRGELETYSGKTLKLYHTHLKACRERNQNLLETRCLIMVKGAGYASLEAAETALSPKHES